MRVEVKARNRSLDFEVGQGEKILYAALRRQARLPYECATGTCGTCRAKLVEGEIEEGWPAAPGRKFCRAEGEFLMCQCTARSDLRIEVGGNVPEADPAARRVDALSGTVSAVRALTHDVAAVDVALDAPCAFEAGQFMAVGAPGIAGMRGYSMVNFARPAQLLEFVIKKKPGGGLSEWLFSDKAPGAKIELFGPLGKATYEPGLEKDILCIAGGSGIAGMMSILKRAGEAGHFGKHRGTVFFGVRTMRDLFFARELSDLKTRQCGSGVASAQVRARLRARGGEAGDGGQVPERARLPRRAAARGGRGDEVPLAGGEDRRRQHPLRQVQLRAAMTKKMACRKSEVPANGLKECEMEGGQKVVVANSGDEYFAVQAQCPHQEIPLCEGMLEGTVLTCHQHLWQWDIRTGEPQGLAEAPLERYEVKVEGEDIMVGEKVKEGA